jgi:hypothetical protein
MTKGRVSGAVRARLQSEVPAQIQDEVCGFAGGGAEGSIRSRRDHCEVRGEAGIQCIQDGSERQRLAGCGRYLAIIADRRAITVEIRL